MMYSNVSFLIHSALFCFILLVNPRQLDGVAAMVISPFEDVHKMPVGHPPRSPGQAEGPITPKCPNFVQQASSIIITTLKEKCGKIYEKYT